MEETIQHRSKSMGLTRASAVTRSNRERQMTRMAYRCTFTDPFAHYRYDLTPCFAVRQVSSIQPHRSNVLRLTWSSGITMTQRYPLALHSDARHIPVLPDVPSTTVPPFVSFPLFSASLIMLAAMRSLLVPPGLRYSTYKREAPRVWRVNVMWLGSIRCGAAEWMLCPALQR